MRERGILFSIMVFLLLASLLSLHTASLSHDNIYRSITNENNAFRKVADKFSNVKNNVIVLTTSEKEQEVDKRILPFSYSNDSNSIAIETGLPVRASEVDSYLSVLNAFRVFMEDTNYGNAFDSMHTDINTLLPQTWGGMDRNVSFLVEPQCTRFSILDENTLLLDSGCADFNYLSHRKQQIVLSLKNTHDFNSVACNFNGLGTCFNDDFNAQNSLPYLNVTLDAEECPSCFLAQPNIRGHFDPAMAGYIDVVCVGGGCTSEPIGMDFSGATRIDFGGQRIDLNMLVEFDSDITGLGFNDANIGVDNRDFGIKRWT